MLATVLTSLGDTLSAAVFTATLKSKLTELLQERGSQDTAPSLSGSLEGMALLVSTAL